MCNILQWVDINSEGTLKPAFYFSASVFWRDNYSPFNEDQIKHRNYESMNPVFTNFKVLKSVIFLYILISIENSTSKKNITNKIKNFIDSLTKKSLWNHLYELTTRQDFRSGLKKHSILFGFRSLFLIDHTKCIQFFIQNSRQTDDDDVSSLLAMLTQNRKTNMKSIVMIYQKRSSLPMQILWKSTLA